MAVLLLAFIVVPLLELFVIGEVAGWIGLGPTILVLFLDSLAGAVLVRREGRRAWDAFRRALGELRWPGDEVMQGALVLVGGALLVTPGFLTDLVGLAMVFPATRAVIARTLRSRVRPGTLHAFGAGADRRPGPGVGRDGPGRRGSAVLDVEVVSIEPDDPAEPDDDGDT